MTLAQLSLTVALLGVLGLAAGRIGLSAIPAYLLAGLLLGPNEPKVLSLIHPSDVTTFVADVGVVFLLFFLGLEFSLPRLLRSGRHVGVGGGIDLLVNAGLGAIVGIAAFGFHFAALVLAAAVYVSSSAVAVKGLLDLRRLSDPETARRRSAPSPPASSSPRPRFAPRSRSASRASATCSPRCSSSCSASRSTWAPSVASAGCSPAPSR